MRRLWILLIGLLLIQQIALAQPDSPKSPIPKNAILPPGYQCTMTVYTSADGKPNAAPAKVEAYVIWVNRPLTLEYYVSDELNGTKYWNVMSRESLDATCK